MYTREEKTNENTASANRRKSMAVANSLAQKKNNAKQGFRFDDNRAGYVKQLFTDESERKEAELYFVSKLPYDTAKTNIETSWLWEKIKKNNSQEFDIGAAKIETDSLVGHLQSSSGGELALEKRVGKDKTLAEVHKRTQGDKDKSRDLKQVALRLQEVPDNITEGREFAKGGTSKLYDIEGHPDLLIKKGGGRLSAEAFGLITLEMARIPCVYTATRGNSIIVRKIDGVGSKDVIGRQKQRSMDKDKAKLVTDKTVTDLESIYDRMSVIPLNIGDFQFIIRRSDGAVFLNDPVSVTIDKKPAAKILDMIATFKGINNRRKKGEYDTP